MKRFLIITSLLIITLIAGAFIYPKLNRYFKGRPVKNADILRKEIIASISNPFAQADTVILETTWGFCGNTNPNDLPIVFDSYLENEAYKQLLSKQLHTPVVTMNEFHKVMETVRQNRFNGGYVPGLWNICRTGKVSADIKAEQFSPNKVRVYENYLYNDTAKYVRKDFAFNNGKWSFTITDTSTQILSNLL